jgi:hypothetical protein
VVLKVELAEIFNVTAEKLVDVILVAVRLEIVVVANVDVTVKVFIPVHVLFADNETPPPQPLQVVTFNVVIVELVMVVVANVIVPLPNTCKAADDDGEAILNIDEVAPVEDAKIDNAPLDIIPPVPTNNDVPAIILPWAKMSFRDIRLPTSAEWAIRPAVSVPEISTTDILLAPELATYA